MKNLSIIGAITGDVIGSVYEWNNHKSTDFDLFNPNSFFTDDTVLTIAIADSLINNINYVDSLKNWGRKYPNSGYGGNFNLWLNSDSSKPYNSWGNGSAMRVSPIGFAYNNLDEVLINAKASAEVTHNHPEGIKGAQATAAAIFLARIGKSKTDIKEYIENEFSYDLNRTTEQIRPIYKFNESCQETVPEAIIAFLESTSFENAIKLAISLGGDSDTLTCITGGIALAYHKKMDIKLHNFILSKLPDDIKKTVHNFEDKYSHAV